MPGETGQWSEDHQWFWDGAKWNSAVSEGGDTIYDGTRWMPFAGERSEAPPRPAEANGADTAGETEDEVPTSLAVVSPVTFSPDGQWWWSNGEWLPTHLTDDGHQWWNGTEWLPFTGVNGETSRRSSDVAVHQPVGKEAVKKAREAYKQAEKNYRDAVKQAETELKVAQEAHSKAVQSSQKQLADVEGSYRKAVQNAQQVLQSWSNPGHGRRLATYQGITLYEHAIATPQGTAPTLGASATVDTAGNLAVTKRVTLTRLVAGGIIGGLIFQKKSKDDTRELYIVIETPTIVTAVKCPPDQGMRARQLAANIQQQANWAANWTRQRETALPQAEAWLSHVTADTAAWQAAWAELARVQADPAYIWAVDEARKRLSETRRDLTSIEAARGGLTAIGEAPPPLALAPGPPMDPLNSKEEEVLKSLLSSDEAVLAAAVGNGGQSVAVTSERVVVIKLNFGAGSNKGTKRGATRSWSPSRCGQVLALGLSSSALEPNRLRALARYKLKDRRTPLPSQARTTASSRNWRHWSRTRSARSVFAFRH